MSSYIALISDGSIRRPPSLSDTGYYFLLTGSIILNCCPGKGKKKKTLPLADTLITQHSRRKGIVSRRERSSWDVQVAQADVASRRE